MRRLMLVILAMLPVLGFEAMAVADASAAIPAWTTYRHDAARTGVDPDSTRPVTPSQAWQTPELDGEVYAQPLVYGRYVYVATENDSVYELDATTGAVVWANHLATPEPSSVAPPVGIGGSTVIGNPATGCPDPKSSANSS